MTSVNLKAFKICRSAMINDDAAAATMLNAVPFL